MSTKIYNGYELNGETLETALALLKRFRVEVIRPLAQELSDQFLANLATSAYDREYLGWEAAGGSHLDAARGTLESRQTVIRATRRRDPGADYEFELVLIPQEGRLFAITYTEQPGFLKAWGALPEVSYFGYWDNAGPEEGVSEADWNDRERIWGGIFGAGVAPAEAGYCVTLSPVDGAVRYSQRSDLECYIPSLENRAGALVAEQMDRDNVDSGRELASAHEVIRRMKQESPAVKACLMAVLEPVVTCRALDGAAISAATPATSAATPVAPSRPRP